MSTELPSNPELLSYYAPLEMNFIDVVASESYQTVLATYYLWRLDSFDLDEEVVVCKRTPLGMRPVSLLSELVKRFSCDPMNPQSPQSIRRLFVHSCSKVKYNPCVLRFESGAALDLCADELDFRHDQSSELQVILSPALSSDVESRLRLLHNTYRAKHQLSVNERLAFILNSIRVKSIDLLFTRQGWSQERQVHFWAAIGCAFRQRRFGKHVVLSGNRSARRLILAFFYEWLQIQLDSSNPRHSLRHSSSLEDYWRSSRAHYKRSKMSVHESEEARRQSFHLPDHVAQACNSINECCVTQSTRKFALESVAFSTSPVFIEEYPRPSHRRIGASEFISTAIGECHQVYRMYREPVLKYVRKLGLFSVDNLADLTNSTNPGCRRRMHVFHFNDDDDDDVKQPTDWSYVDTILQSTRLQRDRAALRTALEYVENEYDVGASDVRAQLPFFLLKATMMCQALPYWNLRD